MDIWVVYECFLNLVRISRFLEMAEGHKSNILQAIDTEKVIFSQRLKEVITL